MVGIKGMKEIPTDCKKCPLMGAKGNPTEPIFASSPMMCVAIWATTHDIKYCIGGKIRDDCPLVKIVTCQDCEYCNKDTKEGEKLLWCKRDGFATSEDYYCGSGKERADE